MTLKMKHLLVLTLLPSVSAFALPKYSTRDLEAKDFAEMQEIVHAEAKKCYGQDDRKPDEVTDLSEIDEIDSSGSRQTPEIRSCLKNIVALVLARREQNDAVQTAVLKKALFEIQEDHRIEVLKQIADEAISDYKNAKDDKKAQATAYEQIKNVLTEAKSRARTEKKNDVKPIIQAIQNANLEVDRKLSSYRANGPAGITPNLSDKAKEVLKTSYN